MIKLLQSILLTFCIMSFGFMIPEVQAADCVFG